LFSNFNERRYRKKGQKLLSSGNAQRAKHYFLKSISISDSVENLFNLALSQMALFHYSEAEELLIKIYNKFPENELNSLALIDCLLMQRKWKESEKISDEFKQNNSGSKAISNFSELIKNVVERERYVSAKENMNNGFKEIDAGNKDKALDFFLKAEKHMTDNPDLLNNIGLLYFERSKYQEAYEYFKNALILSNGDIRIQKNLIRTRKKIPSDKR